MLFFILYGCNPDSNAVCQLPSTNFVPARVIQGEVLWLPQPENCTEDFWSQSSGESNTKFNIVDDWSYITLNETGTHLFTYGELQHTIDVVASDEVPFHNLAYYSSKTILRVDSELWISQVFSPTITVVTETDEHEIPVGSWPVAITSTVDQNYVLVAQRASDTLGLVSVQDKRIIDSIPVGDEPTNIVVHPNGKFAYVSLITEGKVAVVDLERRETIETWAALRDAYAMDITQDGSALIVLSKRSGHTSRFPYENDPIAQEIDGVLLSTYDGDVLQEYYSIGGTNNAVLFSDDDSSFYISTTEGNNEYLLTSGEAFFHYVRSFDTASGELISQADLRLQDSSGGPAVSPHNFSLYANTLSLVAEGSNQVVQLDADSLEETNRISTTGFPRDVFVDDEGIFVHGLNDFTLQQYSPEGETIKSVSLGVDPRSAEEQLGHKLFFGAGLGFAGNHACNSCHADTRGDTRVWRAGPLEVMEVSRSLFWLQGTEPLGWSGYVTSSDNFAFTGSASINRRLTTEESLGMRAFLESLQPPPSANARTLPDGSLSEAAQRGKDLYEGKAACSSCHALPLTTNNVTTDTGITFEQTSTPALVGVYRHGTWLKHGEGLTLSDTIDQVLTWLNNDSLSTSEKDDLTTYLNSMTDRHLFILNDGLTFTSEHFGIDHNIVLVMNQPVWDQGLEYVLEGPDGIIESIATIQDHQITIEPLEYLQYDTDYTFTLSQVYAFDGRALFQPEVRQIHTAKQPSLIMEGEYSWTVDVPSFNPSEMIFDANNLLPFAQKIYATPTLSGAVFTLEYGEDMQFETVVVIDDKKLKTLPLPVSFGNSAADSSGINATILDTDNDGIADTAVGTTTLTGPGMWFEGLFWSLEPSIPLDACELGRDGSFEIEVISENGETIIFWEGDPALGLYITTYSATIPLGPGQTVSNGSTYWVLETENFPTGFISPVSYGSVVQGAVDSSEIHNALLGGEMLEFDACYKVSVIREDFSVSSFTFIHE